VVLGRPLKRRGHDGQEAAGQRAGTREDCNRGFSSDEEYVACLIEAAVLGTTDPEKMRRERVAKTLRRQHRLRSRIEASRHEVGGQTSFTPEEDRVKNVLLKLARGHAVFELSAVRRDEPNLLSCWPLHAMMPEDREAYEAPYFPEIWGEVGSRGSQRAMVITVDLVSADGDHLVAPFVINDWLEVQEDRYRYLAYETPAEVIVKIVIGEYLACLVTWPS
jgi:hypothetical protein